MAITTQLCADRQKPFQRNLNGEQNTGIRASCGTGDQLSQRISPNDKRYINLQKGKMPRSQSKFFGTITVLLLSLDACASMSGPAASQSISMTSAHWHSLGNKTDVQYEEQEGFADGIIRLKSGDIALNDLSFRDGTIEFDMKPLAEDIPGIRFRVRDHQNAEEFYIRSLPDCRAENDCIQYSPVIHGFMLWNVYPEYQVKAPVFPDGWNHVKLVVAGKRMNVFINDAAQPTLEVAELLADTAEGGFELHGPAVFANLTVTPGKTDGLSPTPSVDEIGSTAGIVHAWKLGPLTDLHYGSAPTYAERPQDHASWTKIHSERFGVVNLNRQFNASQEPSSLTWLTTFVDSDREQSKLASLGWLGQVWIFVNGVLIASDKNFYYPESERKRPDARLSLENGTYTIPLRRGRNEITIALHTSIHDDARSRTPYGWGLAMRYNDLSGLTLQSTGND